LIFFCGQDIIVLITKSSCFLQNNTKGEIEMAKKDKEKELDKIEKNKEPTTLDI